MANDVKIQINAEVKKAQQSIDSLGKTLGGLGEKTEKANSPLKNLGDKFSSLTGISMGAAGGIAAAGMAIKAAADFAKEAFTETVAYAEQVRDLGRISGESAEETSRLIQVADDLKVSYETITMAARTASQKGIAMTTESIAKLADEYRGIKDPADKAAFAMEKFGSRAGLEMAKMLEVGGDALRDMAKEQRGGLILTQKQVDAAREYEIAQDQLNDTVMALKVSIGNGLVPVISDLLKGINNVLTATERFNTKLEDTKKATLQTSTTVEEYNDALKDQAIAEGLVVNEMGDLVQIMYGGEYTYEVLIEKNYALKQAEFDLAKETDELNRKFDANLTQLALAPERYDDYSESAGDLATRLAGVKKEMDDVRTASDKLIKESLQPLTREMFENKVMAMLTGDALLDYARATGRLDEKTYQTLKQLEKIKAAFDTNKDGTIDAAEATDEFKRALDNADIVIHPGVDLEIEMDEAEVRELKGLMGMPDSKQITITTTLVTNRLNQTVGGEQTEFATGGQFVVPGGYENHTWPVGPGMWAETGEVVTITPQNGRHVTGGASVVYNVYGWQGDAASLAREMNRQNELARLLA